MPLKIFCKTCNIFGLNCYVLVIIAIGLTILFASCASFEHLTMVTEETFPQAGQCGKCHVEIYHEWSNSDHSTAYTNPDFQKSTDNYSFENCLSCHAPAPTVTDSSPVTRIINRNEGVTCVSCHLKEGSLSGPIEPTGKVAPHPIGVNPDFYKDSGICGRCHQAELREWKSVKTDKTKTCQQCHMPPVTRKVTQSTGGISKVIVAFEHEVLQKRHDFAIKPLGLTTDTISVETKKTDSTVIVTIKNNLPHSLPTGDFGFRILILKILAADSQGNLTVIDQRELVKELSSAIPPLSKLNLELEMPADTASVRVQLIRQSYENDKVIKLTDVEMPL